MCNLTKHCHLSLTEFYKHECSCTCTFTCFRHVEDGILMGKKNLTGETLLGIFGHCGHFGMLQFIGNALRRSPHTVRQISSYLFFQIICKPAHLHDFYVPGLNGPPGASNNRIVCLSIRLSIRLSVCLSVIPSRLQSESAIF